MSTARLLPLLATTSRQNELSKIEAGEFVSRATDKEIALAAGDFGRMLSVRHGLAVVRWSCTATDVEVRLVLTETGEAALEASRAGFVWNLTDRVADIAQTRDFWKSALRGTPLNDILGLNIIHDFVSSMHDRPSMFDDLIEQFWRNEITRLPDMSENDRDRLFAFMRNPPTRFAHLTAETAAMVMA